MITINLLYKYIYLYFNADFQTSSLFFPEEEEKPADLNARILFKAPNKAKEQGESSATAAGNSSKRKHRTSGKDKTSKKLKNKTLLSFNDEEDEEQ